MKIVSLTETEADLVGNLLGDCTEEGATGELAERVLSIQAKLDACRFFAADNRLYLFDYGNDSYLLRAPNLLRASTRLAAELEQRTPGCFGDLKPVWGVRDDLRRGNITWYTPLDLDATPSQNPT